MTINTHRRKHIFGRVEKGAINPSEIGRILETDWRAIPSHFDDVSLDAFCIMPNHLHGIIDILRREMWQIDHRVNAQFGKPIRGSLSTIISAFKAGVTWKARQASLWGRDPLWQSRFYDRIIRDSTEHYRIRRYIELNATLWEYDHQLPQFADRPDEGLERVLRERHDIDGKDLYEVLTSRKRVRPR